MTPDITRREVLLCSRASAIWQPSDFGVICRAARRNNAAGALNAALLFDGERFAQLIQGPTSAVDALLSALGQDPRHERLQIICDAPIQLAGFGAPWLSGFCAPDALDIFSGPDGLRDVRAFAAMHELLSGADLST